MRKIGLLLVLLTLLTMTGLVSAQEDMVFCGNLAEADCNILKQSQTAMMGLTSASFDLSANLNMNGIPNTPPVALSLSGTGAFSVPGGMTGEVPSDPTAAAAMLQEQFNALKVQLDLTVNVPADLAMMIGSQTALEVPLHLRLVDGIGYMDTGWLMARMQGKDVTSAAPRWEGIDLSQVISMVMAQSQASGMSPQMFINPGSIPPELQALTQYINIQRGADATAADGAPVAVFNTTLDLGGLVSDPALMTMMQSQGAEMPSASEMAMAQAAMKALTITMSQSVGINDGYVRSWQLNVNADLSAMGAATGDSEMAGTFSLAIAASMSNFNSAPAIEAPPDAMVTTIEESMFGSGMSQ